MYACLFDKAQQLLKKYHAPTDAMAMWLEWALLKHKDGSANRTVEAFDRTTALNPFVKNILGVVTIQT